MGGVGQQSIGWWESVGVGECADCADARNAAQRTHTQNARTHAHSTHSTHTHTHTHNTQQDKVSSRSRDGRRLRRSVLKGSVVAFITAGYSGKRFVFETAHELGVKAIVLDAGDR